MSTKAKRKSKHTSPTTKSKAQITAKLERNKSSILYNDWLNHVNLLYQHCTVQKLHTPSTTVAFVPHIQPLKNYTQHSILYSHNRTVALASAILPRHDYDITVDTCDELWRNTTYRCNHSFRHVDVDELTDTHKLSTQEKVANTVLRYMTDEQNNLGRTTINSKAVIQCHANITNIKVQHNNNTQCNKHTVAIRTLNNEIELNTIDLTLTEATDTPVVPETPTLLTGLTTGVTLSWSHTDTNYLAAADYYGIICIYDTAARSTEPLYKFTETGKSSTKRYRAVHDISFCSKPLDNRIAVAGDDCNISIFDLRQSLQKRVQHKIWAHKAAINSIQWRPGTDELVTCSNELSVDSHIDTIRMWDSRKLDRHLFTLNGLTGSIGQVQWNELNNNILAATGVEDYRIALYDMKQINNKLQHNDDADTTQIDRIHSDVTFMHGGHTGRVREFAWSTVEPMLMCSVADDNTMQLFKPHQACL